ncbi:MAG: ribosome maturation factor RimM [Xanthobacteraceae bacterium]
MAAGRICVAEIGGAHGIGGEVKLKSFTADPMALKGYSPLESEDGTTRFAIEALRPGKSHLIAQLRGILDRSAAERLAGVKLFVPRACLPPVATDEFYHADLVGLRAITAEGAEIGTVMAVHDFGAGAILELQLAQSDATLMLPFTATCVPEVDLARGRIMVVPPEEN